MKRFAMAKLVLRSLFAKPVTTKFPFKTREPFAGVRGQIYNRIEDCIFCTICARKCPSAAIEVERNDKVWQIAHFECVQCGCRVEVCPKKCLTLGPGTPAAARERGKEVLHGARVSGDA